MGLRASPKDVLRWVVVVVLAAFALGAAAVAVVMAAGKFGVRLIATFEMDLLIATIGWSSILLSAAIAVAFAIAVALLIRRDRRAIWAWLAGFAGAALQQSLESLQASRAGAETDPTGFGVLLILAVMGWGIYTVNSIRRPPTLPRRR